MKTAGQRLESFAALGVEPRFERHDEKDASTPGALNRAAGGASR